MKEMTASPGLKEKVTTYHIPLAAAASPGRVENTGLDVSATGLESCRARASNHPSDRRPRFSWLSASSVRQTATPRHRVLTQREEVPWEMPSTRGALGRAPGTRVCDGASSLLGSLECVVSRCHQQQRRRTSHDGSRQPRSWMHVGPKHPRPQPLSPRLGLSSSGSPLSTMVWLLLFLFDFMWSINPQKV